MADIEIKDFSDQLHEYINGILSGDNVACKMLRYACERHVRDVAREDDDDFEFWFDMESANVVLTVMSHFTVPIGSYAGHPMKPFDFQVFIFSMLYGWREKTPRLIRTVDPDGNPYEYDGYLRRFTEAFITMGRGNSKTPICAVNSILQVAYDRPWIPGAEVYLTATKEGETDKTFSFATQLIKEAGIDGFQCFEKAIVYDNKNFIKKIPTVSGDSFEIQCVIRDELHAWQKKKHTDFYGKIRTGLAKRPQPLAISITTAGDDLSSIWIAELSHARKVLDPNNGLEDDRLFAFICELDIAEIDPLTGKPTGESDDIHDEAMWPKANPAMKYGIINVNEIRRLAVKAKGGDKAAEKDLKRYHMNIRTSSHVKVFEPAVWATGHNVIINHEQYAPEVLGLDIGFSNDPSSLASLVFGPEIPRTIINQDGKEEVIQVPTFSLSAEMWVPEDGVIDIESGFWPAWIEEGLVTSCPGEQVQVSWIKHRIQQIVEDPERNAYAIVIDPNWVTEIKQWAEQEMGLVTIEFRQTHRQYNEPMREFVTANKDGRIAHNLPTLDYCASNMVAVMDHQNRMKPDKNKSEGKIDAIVASIMAFGGAMYEKPKTTKSVYSKRGFQTV